MMPRNKHRIVNIAIITITLVIIAFVGWQVIELGKENHQEWRNSSEQWCTEHNGTLKEKIAGGKYSGLECDLPSGKTVDMGEVAYRDYPNNTSQLPKLANTPYRQNKLPTWYLAAAGIAIIAVVALFKHRQQTQDSDD